MLQADAAGRAKGEKKREKTSTSSKENFEQNNGTKREKKRVSPSYVKDKDKDKDKFRKHVTKSDVALVPFSCLWKGNNQGGREKSRKRHRRS